MSHPKPVAFPSKFKGYSQNDIRYRLMVNDLKIRLEKGKLMHAINDTQRQADRSVSSWVGKFDTFLSYGEIAFVTYRTVKNIVSFFKGSRRSRCSR